MSFVTTYGEPGNNVPEFIAGQSGTTRRSSLLTLPALPRIPHVSYRHVIIPALLATLIIIGVSTSHTPSLYSTILPLLTVLVVTGHIIYRKNWLNTYHAMIGSVTVLTALIIIMLAAIMTIHTVRGEEGFTLVMPLASLCLIYANMVSILGIYTPYSLSPTTNNPAYTHAARQWHNIKNGMSLKQAQISSKDIPIVLGGLGEIRTAKNLQQGLPQYASRTGAVTLINGTQVLNTSGAVSADIDHLLITERMGTVMIDSKVYRDAPRLRRGRNNSGYELTKHSPHAEIISTCIYEAEALPAMPQALIISLSGQALKDPKLMALMNKHNDMILITHYYDRFTSERKKAPLPIFIVPQKQIALTALSALSHTVSNKPVTKQTLTVNMLRRAPGLRIPTR